MRPCSISRSNLRVAVQFSVPMSSTRRSRWSARPWSVLTGSSQCAGTCLRLLVIHDLHLHFPLREVTLLPIARQIFLLRFAVRPTTSKACALSDACDLAGS